MIDAIISSLGAPKAPFPWLGVVALCLLLLVYGVFEYALGHGVRALWRWATRRDESQKKAAPKDGRESLRRGCLKGPIFVHRSGIYRKCVVLPVALQKTQLSTVVSCV
ncbi:hypothetical protein HZY97_05480 [Sphingomonas sp. R-74633]|uniref:hypothetical protein n=1 Tax=Sphingomonas sp. R-74633 TaxID=2751188 RepID=UPI0015D2A84B|nr:hypothetical protein [Sphingomonas sp. R-74633]NYT40197.1 hypothetical protein [Sphingomonas sp. R-74633]